MLMMSYLLRGIQTHDMVSPRDTTTIHTICRWCTGRTPPHTQHIQDMWTQIHIHIPGYVYTLRILNAPDVSYHVPLRLRATMSTTYGMPPRILCVAQNTLHHYVYMMYQQQTTGGGNMVLVYQHIPHMYSLLPYTTGTMCTYNAQVPMSLNPYTRSTSLLP